MTDTSSATLSAELRGRILGALQSTDRAKDKPNTTLAFEATRGTWRTFLQAYTGNCQTSLRQTIERSIGGDDFMAWSFPARPEQWAELLGYGYKPAPAGSDIAAEAHRASKFEACRAKGHGDANAYEFEDTVPSPQDLPGHLRSAASTSRRAQAYAIAALLDRAADEIERQGRLLSPDWDPTPPCVGPNPGEQIGTGTPAPDSVPPPPSLAQIGMAIRRVRLVPTLPENIAALLESIAKAVDALDNAQPVEPERGFAPDRIPAPHPVTVRSLLRSMRDVLEAVRTRPVSVDEVRSLLAQIEELLGPQAAVSPDPDGLRHFTSITSQEQLRELVALSFANGRQHELSGRLPAFRRACERRGLDPDKTSLLDLLSFVYEQGKAESWRSQNKVGFGFHIDRRTWDSLAPDLRRHVEELFGAIAGVVSAYQMTVAAVPREESGWGSATIIRRAEEPIPTPEEVRGILREDPVEDAKAYVAQARADLDPRTVLHHQV